MVAERGRVVTALITRLAASSNDALVVASLVKLQSQTELAGDQLDFLAEHWTPLPSVLTLEAEGPAVQEWLGTLKFAFHPAKHPNMRSLEHRDMLEAAAQLLDRYANLQDKAWLTVYRAARRLAEEQAAAAPRSPEPLPAFVAFLQRQRQSLEDDLSRVEAHDSTLREWRAKIDEEKHWSIHKRNRCKRDLGKLEMLRPVLLFESLAAFDAKIAPLLDMYHRKSTYEVTDLELIEQFESKYGQRSAPPQVIEDDICVNCNVEYLESVEESLLICPHCATTRPFLDASVASVAYGDEIEYTSFSYKRINHLNEWLNHFQAKEATPVPQWVLDSIMYELYFHRRITDVVKITFRDVRQVQKKLGTRKYYDYTMQVWCKLTGRHPLRLDPACEEKVRLMFMRIQDPWKRHKNKGRKNFLSYPYCMYKFCQLLGYTHLLPYFSLLKGKDKLVLQEVTFQKICKDVGWPFIPIVTHVVAHQDGTNETDASSDMRRKRQKCC